jgi:hypothetical protein
VVPRPDPDVPDLAPLAPDLDLADPDLADPDLADPDLPVVPRDPLDEGRRRFALAETVVGSITSGGSSL